jgi:hypothetical protein
MFVLVKMWHASNELFAFSISLVAALLVQLALQSSGSVLELFAALSSDEVTRRVGHHVHRRVPGASTFKKFYESISA